MRKLINLLKGHKPTPRYYGDITPKGIKSTVSFRENYNDTWGHIYRQLKLQ